MIIKEIRQVACEGLYDRQELNEYYEGLLLYLLGAVRFTNLDQTREDAKRVNPKQLVFYAAMAVQKLIIAERSYHPPIQPSVQIQPYSPLPTLSHKGSFAFPLTLRDELKQVSGLIYLVTFIFALKF